MRRLPALADNHSRQGPWHVRQPEPPLTWCHSDMWALCVPGRVASCACLARPSPNGRVLRTPSMECGTGLEDPPLVWGAVSHVGYDGQRRPMLGRTASVVRVGAETEGERTKAV